ncbi:Thioredoxin-like protein 1 [Golovinomyces cichoracearum]|uniref:Thioredoxin-like protein 1 n=1 Tax=Golovinomyces cichoracearum TaxID=62708 RepID=A0A420IU69_9PEZI|nr:Thioredoxin-like protein 1 [Golovinomyces cichoracearum]
MQFNIFAILALFVSFAIATETVTVTVCAPSASAYPSQGYTMPSVYPSAPSDPSSPAYPPSASGGYSSPPPNQSPAPFTGAASANAVQGVSVIILAGVVAMVIFADWCGPCNAIAPFYEELSTHLSIPNQITFVKINVETQQRISSTLAITALPTFIVFKDAEIIEKITGADPKKIQSVVQKIVAESKQASRSDGFGDTTSNTSSWRLAELPKGFHDVTKEVDMNGLDLLNSDSEFGAVRVLFDDSEPTGLRKTNLSVKTRDWVESDTDEQLMLYIPFQSTLKAHTLHITSLPSTLGSIHGQTHMRPKTIQIYPNQAHILGFEEAESIPATQTITLTESDWDSTGTTVIALRFVKFQNVSSLVLFIVDSVGDVDRTRIDRIKIIGESGERRNPGKLEKVED